MESILVLRYSLTASDSSFLTGELGMFRMGKMRAKDKVLVWSDFMFQRVETLAAA
jgi:hypothetical protein